MITISDIKSIRIAVAEKNFIQTHLDLNWSLDIIKGAHPDRISCSMRTLYRLADRSILKKEDLQKSKCS